MKSVLLLLAALFVVAAAGAAVMTCALPDGAALAPPAASLRAQPAGVQDHAVTTEIAFAHAANNTVLQEEQT
jgi:hypothetical protein